MHHNTYVNNAYYILLSKKIFFFSDIEGSNVYKNLNKNKLDDLNNIKITNGIITDIDDNISLVFLGDLIDHKIYDIRWMNSMNKIKKKNPNNLILITGNRDLNKILLFNEFIINNNNENVIYEYINLCDNNKDILSCYTIFIDYCKMISKYFNKKYFFLTNNIIHILVKYSENFSHNHLYNISRIKYIYKYILNAPYILKNRKIEIEQILNISDKLKKNFKLNKKQNCAFVLLFNMILFGNYQTDNVFINKFKNIEMEYLLNTHLLALINYNNKKYLLSHSYIPSDGMLSIPFASVHKNNFIQQHDLKHFLFQLNNIFINKLSFLSNCYMKKTSDIDFIKFNKYINNLMSMCCHKYFNYTQTNVNNANIVTRQYKLFNLYGGSLKKKCQIKSNHKKIYYNFFDNSINKTPIDFLLIGHTPFGSIPTIDIDNKFITKIIHLDVSKGDGVPVSIKTFCFFVASQNNHYFIGRIHFVNPSKNKKLNIKYYFDPNDQNINNLFVGDKLIKNISTYYVYDLSFLIHNQMFQIINNYITFIVYINKNYYSIKSIIGNYQNKFLNKYYFDIM